MSPSAELLASARAAFSSTPRIESCGPFQLLTDSTTDDVTLTCRALAGDLDRVYRDRVGEVEFHSGADGLIAVFSKSAEFRAFAKQTAGLRAGYEAFTLPSRGLVALTSENSSLERLATSLAHELAHLAHRRAFPRSLPPWLSEGIADLVGDTATPTGFAELDDLAGVEPLASRLQMAISSGQTETAVKVMAKGRSTFDRGTVSYDYETSALLVRMLVLDPELRLRFHGAVGKLGRGEPCAADCFLETLMIGADEVDQRLELWLNRASTGD